MDKFTPKNHMKSNPQLLRDSSNKHLYFIDGTRRRRVVFPEVVDKLKQNYDGLNVKEVVADDLTGFEPGAVVPREWSVGDWIEPPQNKQMMREIITSSLSGVGIEYGAGSRPMPLPISANVTYAEPFQSPEQYERMSYTDNTVVANLDNPIENQHQIETGSLDFVVAAHVIEHTPNPVGAIVESHRCLKKGGKLVLVIPDKRRTFDKNRELTSLDHLVADYENPDRERDLENYLDFFQNARMAEEPLAEAKKAHGEGIDIHYHVWDPSSFHSMMTHIVDNFADFSSFEIKPPVADDNCLEFYLVATK